MPMMPYSSASPTRKTRPDRGRRNRRRDRTRYRWPAMTSASSLKRNSGASGPKVSLRHFGAVGNVDRDGRLEEVAAQGVRFAAGDHLRAFGDGIGNVFFNFATAFSSISGPVVTPSAGRRQCAVFPPPAAASAKRSYTPSRTYRRLAQTQVCPALRNFDASAPRRLYRGRHRQRR